MLAPGVKLIILYLWSDFHPSLTFDSPLNLLRTPSFAARVFVIVIPFLCVSGGCVRAKDLSAHQTPRQFH